MSERGITGSIVVGLLQENTYAIIDFMHWITTHNSMKMNRNGIIDFKIVENPGNQEKKSHLFSTLSCDVIFCKRIFMC